MSAGPQPRHVWVFGRRSVVRKCGTARALARKAKFRSPNRCENCCKDAGNEHGLRQVPHQPKPTDRLLFADGALEPTRRERLYLLSFPVCCPHLLKQSLKNCRQGNAFIYFLLESTCSSGPRPVHSNVPAAGFRDKQTEKGTPVFFVADLAFPSRIAHGRDEPRDAGRAPPNARAEYGRHCIESVAAAPVARPDPHAPPTPFEVVTS